MTEEAQPMAFDNGLTNDNGLTKDQSDLLDDMTICLNRMIMDIERLPRHRSLSLAITKLDEASHWLRDRQHRAP